MINSKKDYIYYLEADRLSLGKKRRKPRIFGDEVWRFERLLRTVEYLNNCKNSTIYKPYFAYIVLKYHILSIALGFTIPKNVFGPGLAIVHRGTIVVSDAAKIGENCRIHACTNIGANSGSHLAPQIGNNVYVGPGAKIFGDISIADGIAIGANSVVNKSFHEKGIGIAGVPAKKINDKGSEGFLVKATELIRRDQFKYF